MTVTRRLKVYVLIWCVHFISQVMIDFQAAERKRLEEPASEIGLEPLCAMVSQLHIKH